MDKLFVSAICALILLAGCGNASPRQDPARLDSRRKTSFDYFGTVCFASVYDDFSSEAARERFDSTWGEITRMLAELDAAASLAKPDSDISRFNAARGGECVRVSPLTADILQTAKKLFEFTGGAFNPAVENLVDLWGFTPRFRDGKMTCRPYDRPPLADGSLSLPDRRYVEAFRKLSDFSLVTLSGNAEKGFFLTKGASDVVVDGTAYSLKIDLGGIAKGYGAQKAEAILRARGYAYGYVNLGMSSLKLLKRNVSEEGAPSAFMWAVAVSNPDDRTRTWLTVYGKDRGLSTSGTYDVHYLVEGRDYSHIIDPATGEPTQSDVLSVTILGSDAAWDDAISTALCVMGRERAKTFMEEKLKDYRVAMICRSGSGGLELVTNCPAGSYRLQAAVRD
jgi:FAD:protein FMN transferase